MTKRENFITRARVANFHRLEILVHLQASCHRLSFLIVVRTMAPVFLQSCLCVVKYRSPPWVITHTAIRKHCEISERTGVHFQKFHGHLCVCKRHGKYPEVSEMKSYLLLTSWLIVLHADTNISLVPEGDQLCNRSE